MLLRLPQAPRLLLLLLGVRQQKWAPTAM
jgi:hypothetical protein